MPKWLDNIRQRRREKENQEIAAQQAERLAQAEAARQRQKKDVEQRFYNEMVKKKREEKESIRSVEDLALRGQHEMDKQAELRRRRIGGNIKDNANNQQQ